MKVVLRRQTKKMSLMDINKIFSMLQPREDEEDNGESEELNQAVSEDDYRTLDKLLHQDRYKRVINSRSGWGVPSTPLRLAASKGHLRSLEVLLAHGAEVDSLDVKAQTPLFTAVSNGHLECVKALLEAGAGPSGSIYNNCSPLLTAARDGNVEILQQLLEHGAETNVQARVPEWAANSTACSGPLYLAAVYGHLECFRLLLLYGADPNYNCTDERMMARIKEPKTLLEICLRHRCRHEFIKLLLDFGASVYLPNIKKTAPGSEGLELLLQARVTVVFTVMACSMLEPLIAKDEDLTNLQRTDPPLVKKHDSSAHPRSLMSQSRLVVRRILKQAGCVHALSELDIPPVLVSYLQHQP